MVYNRTFIMSNIVYLNKDEMYSRILIDVLSIVDVAIENAESDICIFIGILHAENDRVIMEYNIVYNVNKDNLSTFDYSDVLGVIARSTCKIFIGKHMDKSIYDCYVETALINLIDAF